MNKRISPAELAAAASRFRAVAVDLDGTALLPDSTFSPRVLAAFKRCEEQGIQVLVATGRSPRSAERFRTVIGASGPMIYFNGAAVVDAPSGKVMASTPVPTDVIAGCLEIARRMDLHFQAFLSDERLVCRDVREESVMYRDHTGLQGEVVDFDELLSRTGPDAPVFIKGMYIAEPERFPPAEEAIDQKFGTRVYRARTYRTFLEVMNNGVSKGNALKVALNFRGLDCSQCVAFGDAENDGPMLEAAGLGVAMENASAALKKIADDIAPSNVQDGVAVYLERLLDLKR
jgi:hypothetical protein